VLVLVHSVEVRTLNTSLHRARRTVAIGLIQLIEMHESGVHTVVSSIHGNKLSSVTIIPTDLILVSYEKFVAWTHWHSAEFLWDRMGNNADRGLEVLVFLPLNIFTCGLGSVWTVCTSDCLCTVTLLEFDPYLTHVWTSDEHILVGGVVPAEGDTRDTVEPEILAPLIDEGTTVPLVLENRVLTGNIEISTKAIPTKRIKFEIHRPEESWTTMGELALRGPSASVEPVDGMFMIRCDENRLAEILDGARGAWYDGERRLHQNAISRIVENDTVGSLAGNVHLVTVIPPSVLRAAVIVVTKFNAPWPLKSTAALLDKVPAGAIDEALTDTVLSVVTDVHCAKIQEGIVYYNWG